MTAIGIIVGAIAGLIVYAVGTAITPADVKNEELIWFLVALVVWALIAFNGDRLRFR
jgi:hypothetical protein